MAYNRPVIPVEVIGWCDAGVKPCSPYDVPKFFLLMIEFTAL